MESQTIAKNSQYARSLIEASLDPFVTISLEGKITDVNEASIKVIGLSRKELIDTNFSDYFTDPKKAKKGYLKVFKKGFVLKIQTHLCSHQMLYTTLLFTKMKMARCLVFLQQQGMLPLKNGPLN